MPVRKQVPAKRKRKLVLAAKKHKRVRKPVPVPFPVVPELEAIPTQPLFAAPKDFFTGGGLAMPANYLPEGFVLARDPRPADHHVAEFRGFRTAPDGEHVKCVRYELKPEIVDAIRKHAEQVRKEIALDDGKAATRRDLNLLIAKNRRNGQPTRLFK